jgi:sigma-B regulation protein RsbU (phosphoserine phosphatase)
VDEGLLSLAIGDVAGKGMPAALLMSSALMAFRSQMGVSRSLPDVVRSVNELFARISRPEEHATLFCGRLDLQERVLCYVNAGHPPPLVFRGGRVIPLETGGMPLGIRTPLAYTQGIRQLEEGDLLLLRTDGCTSACDEPGRVFGERRFRAAVKAHSSGSAARLVDEIMTSIRRFAGEAGQRDDQTVIALRIN